LNASSHNPGYGSHGPNSIRTQRFIRARHTSTLRLVKKDIMAEKRNKSAIPIAPGAASA
jgi:hypothetical protein